MRQLIYWGLFLLLSLNVVIVGGGLWSFFWMCGWTPVILAGIAIVGNIIVWKFKLWLKIFGAAFVMQGGGICPHCKQQIQELEDGQ